jgi:hypothetical protein
MLGRHYQFGQAVKADRAAAYFWYGRAERGGFAEAKLFRHLLQSSGSLTAAERAAADKRLAAIKGGTRPVTVEYAAKPSPPAGPAVAVDPGKSATKPAAPRSAIAALPDEKPSFPPPARPQTATNPPPAPKKIDTAAKKVDTAARKAPPSTVVALAPPKPNPPPAAPPARSVDEDDDDAPPTQPTIAPAPPARTYAAVPQTPPNAASDYYSGMDYWRGQQPRYAYPVRPQVYSQQSYPTYAPPAYRPQAQYGTPYPRYAPGYHYGYRQPYYAAPRPYYAPQPYAVPRAYYGAPRAYYAPQPRFGVYANFGRFGVAVWNGRR